MNSRWLGALLVGLIAVTISIPVKALKDIPAQGKPGPRPSPSVYEFPNVQSRSGRPQTRPDAPCTPLHFGFDGNPRKYRGQVLGRYRVPEGRIWHLTNVSVMMERHHGGAHAVAGEWTGVVGGKTETGRTAIAVSSLDNGSGIALQGQGPVDASLASSDTLLFSIWLRPYTNNATGDRVTTDPANYYYTLGASGMDCPA